uniref:Uncharacterized protein n=1 Tax=Macrostomum lignano TaxID=282301 RepID=A0A1I8G6L4_9PLAT
MVRDKTGGGVQTLGHRRCNLQRVQFVVYFF